MCKEVSEEDLTIFCCLHRHQMNYCAQFTILTSWLGARNDGKNRQVGKTLFCFSEDQVKPTLNEFNFIALLCHSVLGKEQGTSVAVNAPKVPWFHSVVYTGRLCNPPSYPPRVQCNHTKTLGIPSLSLLVISQLQFYKD